MKTTRVLISSPSRTTRSQVSSLVTGLPGFSVAALAADLSETFNHAEILVPDLVIIDEGLARLEEFQVMTVLFKALGTGWVLLANEPAAPTAAAGPGAPISQAVSALDPSQGPERWARVLRAACVLPRATVTSLGQQTTAAKGNTRFDKTVVIGSSTGGVDALITLLSAYPEECPPTAIVQHTGRGFGDSLVQLLKRRCKANVQAASDGMALLPGTVCVAAGIDAHLTLAPGNPLRCQVRPGAPVSGHLPSIDMLFRSTLAVAPHTIGVILTGMGQDGAAGLADLRRSGAFTIGQDEASSVVYGMPKAAWERGAVQVQLPIQRIGEEILRAAAASATPDRRLAAR